MKFIGGHNPDLVLYGEGDVELERIDLTKVKDGKSPSVDDLHELLVSKGFKEKEVEAVVEGACKDSTPDCAQWAAAGECTKNPTFMNESCARSCGYVHFL